MNEEGGVDIDGDGGGRWEEPVLWGARRVLFWTWQVRWVEMLSGWLGG